MSDKPYTPQPVIPVRVHHHEKQPLLAEAALKAAFNEVTKCKGSVEDIVCLRLWRYMEPDDPILLENDGEIRRRLVALEEARFTAQLARDSERLQKLVDGDLGHDAFGDLNKALGIQAAAAQPAEAEEEQAVVNWCTQKGWVPEEAQQFLLLAMIRRGLRQASAAEAQRCGGEHLFCIVCKKHLWSFSECQSHFSGKQKNSHQWDTPHIEALAINLKYETEDANTGGSAVLKRYFGWEGLPGIFSVALLTPPPPLLQRSPVTKARNGAAALAPPLRVRDPQRWGRQRRPLRFLAVRALGRRRGPSPGPGFRLGRRRRAARPALPFPSRRSALRRRSADRTSGRCLRRACCLGGTPRTPLLLPPGTESSRFKNLVLWP